jgi:hypothetical protein
MPLAHWVYFIEEQGPQILLELMRVTARLPCCLATMETDLEVQGVILEEMQERDLHSPDGQDL